MSLKRQLCDSHRKRGKRHNSEMSTSGDENLYELPEIVWDLLQARVRYGLEILIIL